jgi:hypothetical protein
MSDPEPPAPLSPDDWPVLFSYTRAAALADGVLVDLTAWAQETGFRIPVACTAAVWAEYLTPPPGSEAEGQSLRGRAHDLLWLLWLTCRQAGRTDRVTFQVRFLQAAGTGFACQTVPLQAVVGPGDDGEPVLTVMHPDED